MQLNTLFVFLLVFSSCYAINNDFNVTLSCSPSKYTANQTYEHNLDKLLLSLTSNVSYNGFFIATAGRKRDKVFGLALCLVNLKDTACANSVTAMASLSFRLASCPMSKAAALWYRGCFLRYSNVNFFGVVDIGNMKRKDEKKNSSGVLVHDERWRSFMANLSSNATSDPRMFASGDFVYSSEEKIFSQVQCTRDISMNGCSYCLNESVSYAGDNWMTDTQSGWIISSSCFIEFEFRPYISDPVSPPSSPSSLPPPSPSAQLPVAAPDGHRRGKLRKTDTILMCLFVPTALLLVSFLVFFWKKAMKREDGDPTELKELLVLDLDKILAATNDFREENRLGRGGYGSVYKGRFPDGQEIAVKRLSTNSAQGATQFMNEVRLVAKLQHKNLVRLLGCCCEGEEKILVYEYVPNKSLDKVLFDPVGKLQLDWGKRVKIVVGIGKGLLYLHEGSRLKIIHRDLKASNILLDQDMTPKISDFGLAKLVWWTDVSESTASGVAGTFGYMAPECVTQGRYSAKSDVFSFGILILEIVTGRENILDDSQGSPNLLTHVWNLWRDGRAAELVDETLNKSCDVSEVLRFLHISLLCVQKIPARRPAISSVLHMLGNTSHTLRAPATPAFFLGTERESEDEVKSGTSGTTGGSENRDLRFGSMSVSDNISLVDST